MGHVSLRSMFEVYDIFLFDYTVGACLRKLCQLMCACFSKKMVLDLNSHEADEFNLQSITSENLSFFSFLRIIFVPPLPSKRMSNRHFLQPVGLS